MQKRERERERIESDTEMIHIIDLSSLSFKIVLISFKIYLKKIRALLIKKKKSRKSQTWKNKYPDIQFKI